MMRCQIPCTKVSFPLPLPFLFSFPLLVSPCHQPAASDLTLLSHYRLRAEAGLDHLHVRGYAGHVDRRVLGV